MWSNVIDNIPAIIFVGLGMTAFGLHMPDLYVGMMIGAGLTVFQRNAGVRVSAPDATVNVEPPKQP